MTETPPRYRTLDRPGPGLTLVAEPDGRAMLWSLNRRPIRTFPCARCGVLAGRNYRPSISRGTGTLRLCRPCVEG